MSTNDQPGPLIGRGRAADIFDIGDGRALRRNRNGAPTETEAAVMTYLHARGYPVPAVFDADGPDLVMERIDGPTMLDAFGRQPWRLRSFAVTLARLVEDLGRVPLPGLDLPASADNPSVLVHGDLHPDNIMLSPNGPIVIDWPNVTVGSAGRDLASTWILIATSRIETSGVEGRLQSVGRTLFLRSFLGRVDRQLARVALPGAAAHRLDDRNLLPEEAANIHRLITAEDMSLPIADE